MSTETPTTEIVRVEHDAKLSHLTINDLADQVQLITSAMKSIMKRDEHYGVVPGTRGKPTLLKAGAEKLSLLFRLAPSYHIEHAIELDDIVLYRIRCTLTHIPTGRFIAEGCGVCSSEERKYREQINTINERVREKHTTLAKPMDVANTVLKMACKRAHVAAVLSGTAASDFFTQDLEDTSSQRLTPSQSTPPQPVAQDGFERMSTAAQQKKFHAVRRDLGWSDDEAKQWLVEKTGIEATKDIPIGTMSDLIGELVNMQKNRDARNGFFEGHEPEGVA